MNARAWLLGGACMIAIAGTCALGVWQVRRGEAKEALQQRIVRAESAPPVVPDASVRASTDGFLYRQLAFTGRWRPDRVVYLDNRPQDGRVGLYVLMPLHVGPPLDVDVIVNRGWIPRDAADRERIAAYRTPTGDVTVTGVALPDEPRLLELGREPPHRLGAIWQNFAFDDFARLAGRSPLRLVLRQNRDGGPGSSSPRPESDGLVRDWPEAGGVMQAQIDRHRGYAFQWFALSLTLVGLLGLQFIKRVRHGRRTGA